MRLETYSTNVFYGHATHGTCCLASLKLEKYLLMSVVYILFPAANRKKTKSGHSHTPPGSRGPSPLTTQVVRARSASPKTASGHRSATPPTFLSQPNHIKEKSETKLKEPEEVCNI